MFKIILYRKYIANVMKNTKYHTKLQKRNIITIIKELYALYIGHDIVSTWEKKSHKRNNNIFFEKHGTICAYSNYMWQNKCKCWAQKESSLLELNRAFQWLFDCSYKWRYLLNFLHGVTMCSSIFCGAVGTAIKNCK